MCAIELAKLASQRSVTTGLPVSAWKVAGVTNFAPASVIATRHVHVIPLQQTRELGRLVRGNAPGHAQQDPSLQLIGHELILPLWRRYMSMADGALAEQPRERLRARGAAALSDAELLALLVRTGARGAGALEIARGHLARYGRVSRLLAAAEARVPRAPGRARQSLRAVRGGDGAGAPRSHRGDAGAGQPHLARRGARLPAAAHAGAAAGGLLWGVPGRAEPRHRRRGAVPRHAHANERSIRERS